MLPQDHCTVYSETRLQGTPQCSLGGNMHRVCDSDSDSVFISIIRIYTRTSTAFTMGGILLRTIVDIG